MQHDTVLQPNQCGGPLVNLDGKAVGINIARASRVASYALPASAIKPLLEELKSGQMVSATPAD
jgi:serine protease Do